MKKLLFLDIDGVLNDHTRHANGYGGMKASCVAELNRILLSCPDAQIVVSSAWRYFVHNGHCTLAGLVLFLQTHGLNVQDRIDGITDPDPETFRVRDHQPPYDVAYWGRIGLKWRGDQIADYCKRVGQSVDRIVVLDDLALDLPALVQTNCAVGLTTELADEVIRRLECCGRSAETRRSIP